jgi:hypothetical protein
MTVLEPKDICEFLVVAEDHEFRAYQAGSPQGVLVVPEVQTEAGARVLKSDGGDFRKWMKRSAPMVNVQLQSRERLLVLRSADYWLPLVFLASDVALPVYLNLVANYLYDKMKGALKGEKARVHLSAVYEATPSGVVKRFNFEGDVEALQKVIKKFDLNEFLDDTPPSD